MIKVKRRVSRIEMLWTYMLCWMVSDFEILQIEIVLGIFWVLKGKKLKLSLMITLIPHFSESYLVKMGWLTVQSYQLQHFLYLFVVASNLPKTEIWIWLFFHFYYWSEWTLRLQLLHLPCALKKIWCEWFFGWCYEIYFELVMWLSLDSLISGV